MKEIIIKLLGLNFLTLLGDTTSFDRFIWLKKNLQSGDFKTLDAGCGSGTYTIYAATIGNNSLGISDNERNTNEATFRASLLNLKNVSFIEYDLRNLSEIVDKLDRFDQIICFETIEHIVDDEKVINNFSKLLITGGRILLTVPYKHYKHLFKDKLSGMEDGGHVRWGYTHEEIREMFASHGIKIIVEEFVSGYISQQLCNLQRILSVLFGNYSWYMILPFRWLQCFDPLITRILHYPYLSIAVIGIKV